MMNPYKRFSLLVLGSLGLFFGGIVVFVYVSDPFQIYHKSIYGRTQFGNDATYQHAGWINRLLTNPDEHYHSIVIGSSTMDHYSEKIINEYLPWGKTLLLRVNGSSPRMQHAIAKHALQKSSGIKHILWDVHYYYAYDPADNYGEWDFPYYLYNNTILDDGPYLLSVSNIKSGFKFLNGDFSDFSSGIESSTPLHEISVASGKYNYYGLGKDEATSNLPPVLNINRSLSKETVRQFSTFSSIDLYMLDVLLPLCNGDQDINIMFSPTTRRYYATLPDTSFLYKQILMRRYIVTKTSHCENIRVFAFDHQEKIVNNLAYYGDDAHYAIEVNRFVIESISRGENRLTLSNIDAYEKAFIEGINAYGVKGVRAL